MEQNERAVLSDVRDPIEITFTGFATLTDIHVPWVLDVAQDDPIIVMCRSGSTRSAPEMDLIAALGVSEVYSVTRAMTAPTGTSARRTSKEAGDGGPPASSPGWP